MVIIISEECRKLPITYLHCQLQLWQCRNVIHSFPCSHSYPSVLYLIPALFSYVFHHCSIIIHIQIYNYNYSHCSIIIHIQNFNVYILFYLYKEIKFHIIIPKLMGNIYIIHFCKVYAVFCHNYYEIHHCQKK